MLKKTITYDTFDGESVTEDFYFNITQAELVELEVSADEGFAESLKKIVASNNGRQIIDTFKKIILFSYGVKSEDGKRFIKNEEVRTEFSQTEAYSKLFMELSTDAGAAAAFVNAVIPQNLANAIGSKDQLLLDMKAKTEEMKLPEPPSDTIVTSPEIPEEVMAVTDLDLAAAELTDDQLRRMSTEEVMAYFKARGQ
jgi:hypothetical protein